MAALVRALSATARRAPVLTIVVVVLLTAVLGPLAGQAQQDQGQESFSPDNPALAASTLAGELFEGAATTVVQVLVTAEDGDVVSPDGLATATAVREAVLEAVPAEQLSDAQGSPVVTWIAPVERSVAAGQLDPTSLTDDAAVDAAYEQALGQLPPESLGITEQLVATDDGAVDPVDATSALALVFLDTDEIAGDLEGVDEVTAAVNAVVRDVVDAVADADAPLAADAFAFELLLEADDSFTDEIGRLFGTAALIIVLILLLVYLFPPAGATTRLRALRRAGADVGLTLFVILASIAWMQGIGVLLGPGYLELIGAFTPPTQIIPILLIGLGVDYAIHVTARYREEVAEGASVERAVERASTTVGVALLLATMTTALGFLTNLSNPVPAIQDFGILAAVGITVAFLLMLTFLPAARVLLDRRADRDGTLPREALGASSDGRLSRITEATAVLGERFAVPVLVVALGLGGLGGYGLTQLSTEFSFADFVPTDNPVRQTFLSIEEDFTGGFGEQTQLVLDGDPATVEAHNATVAAQADLAGVTGVLTVGGQPAADSVVSRIGQQLMLAQAAQQAGGGQAGGGEASQDATESQPGEDAAAPGGAPGAPGGQAPDPAALAAAGEFAATATQLGLQPDLTMAEGTDVAAVYDALAAVDPTLGAVLSGDDGTYRGAQVVVQTQSGQVGALVLADAVEEVFAPVEAAGPEVTATSTAIISDGIVDDLSSSQISSLGLTLAAATVLLVLVFGIRDRRPVLGVVTLFPVGLVLLWVFGTMAATGIPFGPVTSTISGLAIGIGVPFTIHITNRFTEDLAVHGAVDPALRSTLRHTGGALAGSALTTVAGFAVLVSSSLVPFRQLGLVVAYAIGFSLLAALLVLPSLLAIWARWRGLDTLLDDPAAERHDAATGS